MENQEDNPFLIKGKPKAEANKPKVVFTAADFEDISPVSKKKASSIGSTNGGPTTSSPASKNSNGLSWANQDNKSIDISQADGVPKLEKPYTGTNTQFFDPFKPSLGNTVNTNTPDLQNNGGFMQDISGNLNNERFSPKQVYLSEKLTKINKAYDTSNPNITTDKLQSASKSNGSFITGSPDISEREGNVGKYFYNSFLNGIGGLAAAVGDIGAVVMAGSPNVGYSYNDNGQPSQRTPEQMDQQRQALKDWRLNKAPEVRQFLKEKIGANVDKGLEAKYDSEMITGAIGGLFSSAPAMLMPAPLRGAAMILQGYDFGMQSVNSSDANGEVDDLTKTIYATGIGVVNGLLEKVGFDRIMGPATAQVAKKLADKAISQAAKETGGKVTGDVLTKFLNSNIRELSNNFSKVGVKAFDGFVTEFATGSAQEMATIASELLLNKSTGKPIFDVSDPTSMDGFLENIKRVSYSGVQEAIGGGLMGGIFGGHRTKKYLEQYNEKLDKINDELENPDLSDPAKEILVQQKIDLTTKVEDTQKEQESIVAKLTPEQVTKIDAIDSQMIKLETVLADVNLSDELKVEIKKQYADLETELTKINPDTNEAAIVIEDAKNKASVQVEESIESVTNLAEQLTEASSPAEVSEIKSKAVEAGEAGIKASQVLNTVNKVEAGNSISPSYQTGDPISFQNEIGETIEGIVKEVKGGKAVVGINNDGIYSEKEIDLPIPEPSKVADTIDPVVSPTPETQKATQNKATTKVVYLDAKKKKPKKLNENSRTAKQIAREPTSFNDAVNKFFLSGNKVSTEDFITHTGFGFVKEADGKKTKLTPSETEEYLKNGKLQSGESVKMSDELRKAKFNGKVSDRSKGGIDADQVLQFHVPGEFTGDQGMGLVTDVVNAAANVSKSQMLSEMEQNDIAKVNPSEDGNFGYSEAEIAEMEVWEKTQKSIHDLQMMQLTESEIESLQDQDRGNLLNGINNEITSGKLSDIEAARLIELTDSYTDKDGNIDWSALEQDYFDTFISGDKINTSILSEGSALKQIFENGNRTIKQQAEQSGKSKSNTSNDSGQGNSKNDTGTSQRSKQESEKIAKANEKVKTAKNKVTSLQAEVTKLLDKLAKNLKENQTDMFGRNKPQAMFDDKASQQKLVSDKQAELQEAYNDLAKANNELATTKETEGLNTLELPDSKLEVDGKEVDLSKTNEADDAKIIVQSSLNPLDLLEGFHAAVNKFEHNTIRAFTVKVTDNVSEGLKAWRKSKWAAKQWTSSIIAGWFNVLPRNQNDLDMVRGLVGEKGLAVHSMGKMMKGLYSIVDSSIQSLERVHVVLDPEWYKEAMGGQANALNPNVAPNLNYDDLTDTEKMLYDVIRKTLNDIHFKNYTLGFIDIDTFKKHEGTYVPRLYNTHELPSEMQEVLDNYKDQVGDKLNWNPLKKRKDISALSESTKNAIIKDPVYMVAKRMMQLETNAAIMVYLNHINRNNRGLLYRGDNPPVNYIKMEGKAYGALDGKWVPGYLAEDVKGYMFANSQLNWLYDGIKKYDRTWARQQVKKGLTVWNPFVQIGNFTSNIGFGFMAGIDPFNWCKGLPRAIHDFHRKDEIYEDLLGAGLLSTDVVASEMMPNNDATQSLLKTAKAREEANLLTRINNKTLKKFDSAIVKLYGANDDVAKINAYNIFLSRGYSKKDAQRKVFDAFQNYAVVGKMWDVSSKVPVLGNPFIKFSADLIRITGNSVTKNPLHFAMYLGGLAAIPAMLIQFGLSDPEDELEEELRTNRPFIPKLGIGSAKINFVYKTKFGELNVARYASPYFSFDNGEDGMVNPLIEKFYPIKRVTVKGEGLDSDRNLFFGQDPLLGTLWNIYQDADFRGKSIQNPDARRFVASGATDGQKYENIATHALRTWIPMGAMFHDFYLNQKYGEDYYGRVRSTSQALMNMAFKIQKYGPQQYKETADKQMSALVRSLTLQNQSLKSVYKEDGQTRGELIQRLNSKDISQYNYNNSIKRLDNIMEGKLDKATKNQEELHKKINDFYIKYERFLK